ncbi:MAG: YfhO family protein [Candidatus Latescibacterota bacterium]|nr:YfhO family protein [Candidatus Latescibacterota bacterium]
MRDRSKIICPIFLGGLIVFFYRHALNTDEAFFVQDVMVQNYPFREYFSQLVKSGGFSFWNSAISGGFPLFAEGQAGPIYPLNIFLGLLPTHIGISLSIVLHGWLGAGGMYFLMRLWKTTPLASATSGLVFALSGYMVVRAMSPNFVAACAWLPLLCAVITLWLRDGRIWALLVVALIVAMKFLSGHPQAAAYGILAATMYALYLWWALRRPLFCFAELLMFLILGLGLAGPQLVPTAELTLLSGRSEGVSLGQFVNMSLPPERLVELLIPSFHGNSAFGTYWGGAAGFFIQLCPFMGVVAIILSWIAIRQCSSEPVGFFALLTSIGLVLSLGKFNGFFELFYELPGLSFFRIPTRFLLFFSFGISALAGMGLDRLQKGGDRRGYCFVIVTIVCAALPILLNARLFFAESSWVLAVGGENLLRYVDHVRSEFVILISVCFCMLTILLRKNFRKLLVIVPLISFFELYRFGYDFNGTINVDSYRKTPVTASAILDDHGAIVPPRILSLVNEKNSHFNWHSGWAVDASSYLRYNETLRLYSGGQYGLHNMLPGWSPLHLRRQWEFASLYPGAIKTAGIEYLVSMNSLNAPNLELIYASDIYVYRITNTLSRAYLATDYTVVKDRSRRLSLLREGELGANLVLLEDVPVGFKSGGDMVGQIEIVEYRDEFVRILLGNHNGGILVLSDTNYPGWRAFVDGKESPILFANHLFRGVVVSPGTQEVVFEFSSDAFRYGLWGACVTILLLCIALFCRYLKGPHYEGLQLDPLAIQPFALPVSLQMLFFSLVYGFVKQKDSWWEVIGRCRVLEFWGG